LLRFPCIGILLKIPDVSVNDPPSVTISMGPECGLAGNTDHGDT
jgi:hypothetical protein